jgi:uncharacterized protein YjbI with pentapeptide repeats
MPPPSKRLPLPALGLCLLVAATGCGLWDMPQRLEDMKKRREVAQRTEALLKDRACEGCDLSGAQLAGANLQGVRLAGALLRGANLQGANLRGADLRTARVWESNLEGADLREARLAGAHLHDSRLHAALPACDAS